MGPHGVWGSKDKGYLFSGSWEALVIIFRDLGSNLTVQGDLGRPAESKNEFMKFLLKVDVALISLFISMVVIDQS